MNKRERKRLECTAYHEAGHAFTAYQLRRPFRYVTIEPAGDSLGTVWFQRFNKQINLEYEIDLRTTRKLQRDIEIALAGPEAAAILSGRRSRVSAYSDDYYAAKLAHYVCGTDEEAGAYLAWLRIKARDRLKLVPNWSMVRGLAKALLKQKRISAPKAREIMWAAREENYRRRERDRERRPRNSPLPIRPAPEGVGAR